MLKNQRLNELMKAINKVRYGILTFVNTFNVLCRLNFIDAVWQFVTKVVTWYKQADSHFN
jgi:hypothetical protein